MNPDIELYKELIQFCEVHMNEIETKFQRHHSFEPINEDCYEKMFLDQRHTSSPLAPKVLKEQILGLTELYREKSPYYMRQRNSFKKGLDIQLGQWYEKALQLYFGSKGITVQKKGFPVTVSTLPFRLPGPNTSSIYPSESEECMASK